MSCCENELGRFSAYLTEIWPFIVFVVVVLEAICFLVVVERSFVTKRCLKSAIFTSQLNLIFRSRYGLDLTGTVSSQISLVAVCVECGWLAFCLVVRFDVLENTLRQCCVKVVLTVTFDFNIFHFDLKNTPSYTLYTVRAKFQAKLAWTLQPLSR